MRKITTLCVISIIVGALPLISKPPKDYHKSEIRKSNNSVAERCSRTSTTSFNDLDVDGIKESIVFESPSISLFDGPTNIYVNKKDQGVSVNGYYRNSNVITLRRGLKILEVEINTGKSINTLVYQFKNRKLVRIPVSTEHPPAYEGIVARNIPEFKDIDNDGTLEMLAYQRYFPPEAKRFVEVYKFDNGMFDKQKEYDEITPDIYL